MVTSSKRNNMYKIVYYSDWINIYKDGELVLSGHSFAPQAIFDMLGIEYEVEEEEDDEQRSNAVSW